MSKKKKILFLCTGNSCRSQMAEGWARHLHKDLIESYSAGIEKHGLNPYAVQVMAEANVDITSQTSNTVSDLGPLPFDYVVTVCGHANENCPVFFSETEIIHRGFDDPPQLAKQVEEESAKLDCYRRVRDEIEQFVRRLPEWLSARSSPK
ncbi:arsenate reductase ArsC [Mariniblastus sp.]|nr:arsenate reductase ArsC [Mariniblastus sp.]MDB4755761.1 arsenate reductase ArsC [Mariniblastus sp.]